MGITGGPTDENCLHWAVEIGVHVVGDDCGENTWFIHLVQATGNDRCNSGDKRTHFVPVFVRMFCTGYPQVIELCI